MAAVLASSCCFYLCLPELSIAYEWGRGGRMLPKGMGEDGCRSSLPRSESKEIEGGLLVTFGVTD